MIGLESRNRGSKTDIVVSLIKATFRNKFNKPSNPRVERPALNIPYHYKLKNFKQYFLLIEFFQFHVFHLNSIQIHEVFYMI